jgi:DNA-binding XRE family transcriptional regulator
MILTFLFVDGTYDKLGAYYTSYVKKWQYEKRNFNTNLTKQERERIGELVKALRNNSAIIQKELAFKVGVSPAQISQIRKDR